MLWLWSICHPRNQFGDIRKVRLYAAKEGRIRKLFFIWEWGYVLFWLPLCRSTISFPALSSHFLNSHAGSQKHLGFQFLLSNSGALQGSEKIPKPKCCGIRWVSTSSVGMYVSGPSIPSVHLQAGTPSRHCHGLKGTLS